MQGLLIFTQRLHLAEAAFLKGLTQPSARLHDLGQAAWWDRLWIYPYGVYLNLMLPSRFLVVGSWTSYSISEPWFLT